MKTTHASPKIRAVAITLMVVGSLLIAWGTITAFMFAVYPYEVWRADILRAENGEFNLPDVLRPLGFGYYAFSGFAITGGLSIFWYGQRLLHKKSAVNRAGST